MNIKKIIWEPIFSREGFSYFIASLGFEGFVHDMKKIISWGYRDQLMVSKKNFLTVYGSTRDQKNFITYTAKQNKAYFISANKLIISSLRKAEHSIDKINKHLIKKNLSPTEIEKVLTIFYKNYRRLYSVYRFSTLFDYYYNGKFKNQMIKKFAVTKDRCGKFFTKTDRTTLNILKNHLSRIIKVKPDLLLYLNYKEIVKSIHNKKSVVTINELKLRQNSFILLAVDQKIKLIIKNQTKFIKNNFVSTADNLNTNQIIGQTATPGKVRGKVRVVFLASQLKKAGVGAILVTPMTTISHVPFLNNYSAIVTDEGGITSHAAIISRELGIPSVIGTKIATKVLHDGDMVEVDADKGIVRILKRK